MPQIGGPGRAARGPTRSQQLAVQATKKAVRPVLGLKYYYRSAEMLLRQADTYRSQGNEDELYVILMRYASLVLETIPEHSDFRKGVDPQYQSLKVKASNSIEELERLKLSLDTKPPVHIPRPAVKDVVPMATSMLPEADWTLLRPPTSALPRGNSLPLHAPMSPTEASLTALTSPPTTWQGTGPQPPGMHLTLQNSVAPPQGMEPPMWPVGLPQPAAPLPDDPLAGLDMSFATPGAAARERHALVGPIGGTHSSGTTSSGSVPVVTIVKAAPEAQGPLYNISLMESAPVILQQQQQQQPLQAVLAPQFQDPFIQELATMQIPQPSAPPPAPLIQQPQLGPQMVDVIDLMPPATAGPAPPSNCSSCVAPEQQVAVVTSPEKPKEKVGLKDIHISVALMEEFMKFASANTRKGIETCGILAGKLDPGTNIFTIDTLIIPHQEGTSDTVAALNEEDIFEVQDQRSLFPLGWIHTHPTQTCFLSSVDIHTQVGYQTLLDEAIAIVMAPTDRSKRCGIFRLSAPGGLQLIQRCPKRGFHAHPETHTGQPIYELCGHVYLNPRIKIETIDLRR